MSRPRQKLDECKEGAQVLQRLKKEPAGWKRERLQAVRMGLEGEASLNEIAIAIGRARSTIQEWFDLYREGGIERLLSVHRGNGPQSRLSEEAAMALQAGLKTGKWRKAEAIMKFLSKEYDIHVSRSTVYHYLGKCGARLRVARPSHLKKDPAAAQAFKSELALKLEALDVKAGRRVRLWVMDEMRCGLHTEMRRVWGLPGVRPVVPVQQKYEWQYVYGALEVGKAGAQFIYAESVGLEWNAAFLQQIASHDPDAVHVVIYDGAGFHHRDGDPSLPANVRIVSLPPYSPELNPVEKLWDIVRDGICNQVFSSIEELQAAITEVVSRYWQDAKAVFNLIGRGWLLDQANAIGLNVIPL